MQGQAAGHIALTGGAIKPPVIAVYVYIDVIGVWHKQPLTTQQLCWLGAESKPLIKPPSWSVGQQGSTRATSYTRGCASRRRPASNGWPSATAS